MLLATIFKGEKNALLSKILCYKECSFLHVSDVVLMFWNSPLKFYSMSGSKNKFKVTVGFLSGICIMPKWGKLVIFGSKFNIFEVFSKSVNQIFLKLHLMRTSKNLFEVTAVYFKGNSYFVQNGTKCIIFGPRIIIFELFS